MISEHSSYCLADDLEAVIVQIAKELDARNLPVASLGMQFVQIGDDPIATEFLNHLDDNIRKQYNIRVPHLPNATHVFNISCNTCDF